MASPIQYVKFVGQTAGSDLTNKLIVLNNVSIANAFRNIGSWFESIGIGARSFKGYVFAGSGGVPATNAVTFSSIAAADTVTINGVVYTGSNSATTSNVQFKTGGTDTTAALSLANVINGTSANGTTVTPPAKINGIVTATAALGVVTITAVGPGAIGNLYTLAISAHGSVTGATFASGADGVITALAKGL